MRGRIYRLKCSDGNFYDGSTETSLADRLGFHKWAATVRTSPLYAHIKTIGWDAVTIELLEEVECETSDDLKRLENEYIRRGKQDPMCLNVNMAIRSTEEKKEQDRLYGMMHREAKQEAYNRWREQNRDRMREHQKKWRDANKERIAAYDKQYRLLKNNLAS